MLALGSAVAVLLGGAWVDGEGVVVGVKGMAEYDCAPGRAEDTAARAVRMRILECIVSE